LDQNISSEIITNLNQNYFSVIQRKTLMSFVVTKSQFSTRKISSRYNKQKVYQTQNSLKVSLFMALRSKTVQNHYHNDNILSGEKAFSRALVSEGGKRLVWKRFNFV
jgi:hypothetical protein